MPQQPATDPLRLRPHGLEFDELRELREYLEALQEAADESLRHFQEPYLRGFIHQDDKEIDPDDPFSKASTATCVAFLAAAGTLDELVPRDDRKRLRERMIDGESDGNWTSADLPPDNPFTVSFLLDAIRILGGLDDLDVQRKEKVESKIDGLERRLAEEGGLWIEEYDPTAFLTYKAIRVLGQWRTPRVETRKRVLTWTWGHLAQESMLIASRNQDADVFELAYSVLTASTAARLNEMSPANGGSCTLPLTSSSRTSAPRTEPGRVAGLCSCTPISATRIASTTSCW
jgi:hypothetical protein